MKPKKNNQKGFLPLIAIGCIFFLIIFFLIVVAAASPFGFGGGDSGGGGASGDYDEGEVVASTCVNIETVSSVDGILLPYANGKLGHEEHLTQTNPSHYVGATSNPLTFAGPGAFAPHTTDQEHWYVNAQWLGWNWEPTKYHRAPTKSNDPGAKEQRAGIDHKKILITSMETGKAVVASVEESGPAVWVTDKNGVNLGAPPEVYKAIGASDPYTDNPSDNKGRVTIAFVKDQNTALGLCN